MTEELNKVLKNLGANGFDTKLASNRVEVKEIIFGLISKNPQLAPETLQPFARSEYSRS